MLQLIAFWSLWSFSEEDCAVSMCLVFVCTHTHTPMLRYISVCVSVCLRELHSVSSSPIHGAP